MLPHTSPAPTARCRDDYLGGGRFEDAAALADARARAKTDRRTPGIRPPTDRVRPRDGGERISDRARNRRPVAGAQPSAWRREMKDGRRAQAPSPCTHRHNVEIQDIA